MTARRTVLAYHGVADCAPDDDPHNLFVTPAAFEQQMEYLARHRRVIGLDDLYDGGPSPSGGKPVVAITFDDGYRSVLTHAAPVLARHGFPATVFVPTAWLGRRAGWLGDMAAPIDIMDEDELRRTEASGVRVESHGHAHIDLSAAGRAEAGDDLAASIGVLEPLLGHRPRFLAYPFRTGSPGARRAAEDLGFAAAFSIDLPAEGRFAEGRVQVTPLDGDRLFRLKTSGRYLRLRHSPPLAAGYQVVKRFLGRT